MFVDQARIYLKAGGGGKGCESFHREKYSKFPTPDGGDGGKGGDIIIQADPSIQTLLDYRYKQHYTSERGGHAGSRDKTGKTGKDCVLKVPVGTVIKDDTTGLAVRDLVEPGDSVIVARGGKGGLGNNRGRAPALPEPGEERVVQLELKLIADAGLIGFPNAGKSTLICAVSKVRSKIGQYPFTTKQPILGVVQTDECDFVIADLPGLIEGAHAGRGLGDRFLKHAERTKVLVHVIDMAGTEGRDPLEDYRKINEELEQYGRELTFKKKLVVANKMDLSGAEEHLQRFRKEFPEEILPVSAVEKQGLDQLIEAIVNVLNA